MKRNESIIMTYCCLEERKALLTSSRRELHEDVESTKGGLFLPELRDPLPLQHLVTIILFNCELTKRISSLSIKIYIDLQNIEG